MSNLTSREIQLKSRPQALPSVENFEFVEVTVAEPKAGEVLVKNIYMSVDPYMRGRMRSARSYAAPFEIGETLYGGCVGQIIKSKSDDFKEGDYVTTMHGWREYSVSPTKGMNKVNPDLAPLSAFLGTLGMPGMTAYVGLNNIGKPQAGETLFVSAASGAVGAVASQIGKIMGCRVIGSAGSDEKVAWLKEVAGVDAAFNYKKVGNLEDAMAEACPQGIDVYFENVGGAHLEAALNLMNRFGRIPFCGMIAGYNDKIPGPTNLALVIGKCLIIQGFIVSNHADMAPQFLKEVGSWVKEGKIKSKETIVEGIENAPAAFIGLFSGDNFGKMIVKLADQN
ncbi:MAG: NADP-dependent oxidoreductase [SAR324 cluster bacterium]|nr:NADP-dependent oxidoreductase [SAR324 cluster bacterium]